MRQNLNYRSNIFYMAIFALAITIIFTSMVGCASFKKSLDKSGHKKGEVSKLNRKTINKESKEGDEKEYAPDAYYYYMKSERYKQKGDNISAINALKKAIEIDPDSIYLKKNLILLYILNKNNTGAIKAAEDFNKKYPNNEESLIILAKFKLQLNKLNEAKILYETILKLNPKNHDAYIVLGNISIENKKAKEAIKIFSTMAKELPNSYSSHFFLGKIYLQEKNFSQAEKEFLKTIELENDLIEPRFELISLYKSQSKKIISKLKTEKGEVKKSKSNVNKQYTVDSKKNKNQKIIKLYEEILDLDKDNIKASIGLPLYLYKSGDKSKASQMLIDFGRKYKNNDEMIISMAKELVSNENRDDAIIVFNELLKEPEEKNLAVDSNLTNSNNINSLIEKSDKSLIHYIAGLTFNSLKDSKRAMSHFMKVSSKSDQYRKSLFHIAYIYSQLGQNDKAIKFLESKFSQFSKDVELLSYLAAFYEDNNQLEKALSVLKQGLKDAPDETELIFRLGVVLDKKGDKDGSMAEMKKVIELDSEHSIALNYLGYTYAELGINLDEAESLIKRALAIKPEDGYITDSLGWVYYKKGDYDKAIEVLEKAVRLSSQDPVIVEHLGDAYKEKKIYLKAIETYKQAIEKNKKHENRAKIEKKIYEVQTLIQKN